MLLLAVWVVNRTPAINWIAWLLAVPAFVLSLLSVVTQNYTLLVWSALLEATLYFYAAASLLVVHAHDHRVTTDELFAAGATFTLLAWGFAYAFSSARPGTRAASRAHRAGPAAHAGWSCCSLASPTCPASACGDIIPLGAQARVLVMLEQFAGVGYIARGVAPDRAVAAACRTPLRTRSMAVVQLETCS